MLMLTFQVAYTLERTGILRDCITFKNIVTVCPYSLCAPTLGNVFHDTQVSGEHKFPETAKNFQT